MKEKKNNKPEVNTWWNYDHTDPIHSEVIDPVSVVEHGQVMTNEMLLQRFLVGGNSEGYIKGTYYPGDHDSPDLDQINELDLVDRKLVLNEWKRKLDYQKEQIELESNRINEELKLKERLLRRQELKEIIEEGQKGESLP